MATTRDLLIRAGMMPSDASLAVEQVANRAGRLQSPTEQMAASVVTDFDIRQGRAHWFYAKLVDDEFLRILEATDIDEFEAGDNDEGA